MNKIFLRKNKTREGDIRCLHLSIRGVVQGVGFRPFVYRLARKLSLKGWIQNASDGVTLQVEGIRKDLEDFQLRLQREKPPLCSIEEIHSRYSQYKGFKDFQIRQSQAKGDKSTSVLPDIATCKECLKEIFNPSNRRYLYPFTNCTHCGPRFSIINALPYDRPNTSMKKFWMCKRCQKEYEDPLDRRFHAQPNACPACGPRVEFWDARGKKICSEHKAIVTAAKRIKKGHIIAVKGLGGFHLMCDARNQETVKELRLRKHREEKPFALMFPSIDSIQEQCELSLNEKKILQSPEAPIVLIKKKIASVGKDSVSESVAPSNPYFGVLLPYTPLHYLLMNEVGIPVVATSGNISDEPICIDEQEALERLSGIADEFLVHNRPIVRHVDDSIVRIMVNEPVVLRRARGFAPLPIRVREELPSIMGVGAHLKSTVALSVKNNIFLSQHLGDLETEQSFQAFRSSVKSLKDLYETEPKRLACDLHPDYYSTRYLEENQTPVIAVQHHHAHIASCMGEHHLTGDVLGIAWDGTGFGLDGTVWGGEFLLANPNNFKRLGHFRLFSLPGAEVAVKEPRRSALGILYEIFGSKVFEMNSIVPIWDFSGRQREILRTMLENNLNSPLTSSTGRLFDAVASLLNIRQKSTFEGQAAMYLEHKIAGVKTRDHYSFSVEGDPWVVDWEMMIRGVLEDLKGERGISLIAAKFHNTLVEIIVEVARKSRYNRVVLSGGCFQNQYLTHEAVRRLKEEGMTPFWHRQIPPNDGGIALGQVVVVANRIRSKMQENKLL